MPPSVPVVIGVGEFINRSTLPEDAKEPLDLILSAIRTAVDDAQTPRSADLLAAIDSVDIVLSWTWPYADLPALVAGRLGISPRRAATSPHGGNQPAKVFDEAARRVARGEARVALLAGGEALASRESSRVLRCFRRSMLTAWTSGELCGEGGASPTGVDGRGEGCEVGIFADDEGAGTGCVRLY
jgi:acetyl-CoA acetyltransferase